MKHLMAGLGLVALGVVATFAIGQEGHLGRSVDAAAERRSGGAAERPKVAIVRSPARSETVSERFRLCGGEERRACVIDGDTFRLGGERIRIADADAPEIFNAGCEAERIAGLAARDRLLQLLDVGPFQLVSGDRDRDRYGRLLRSVERHGRSLGQVLVDEGLARRWDDRKIAWCGGGSR